MKRIALQRWIPFRLSALLAPLTAAWPCRSRAAQALTFSLLWAGSASGAPLTWDANGPAVPNPAGGTGTWDVNTTTNWRDGATNVVWPALGGTDDDAIFGNNAGIVSIAAGGVTANDLTFNTTGYLIQNDILTLNGVTPTVTAGTGVTATIGSVVAGGAGLVKAGNGTLVLTGVNTYTGTTLLSGGTLQLGAGTIQPTINSTYDIGSGATLRIRHNTATGATAQTWSKFTGAGTLAFATGKNNDSGAATATLGMGFTGNLQLEGGRVQLLAATGAATNWGIGGASKVTIVNGGHLGMWENGITLPASTSFDIAGTGYGEGGFESAIRMGNGSLTTTIQGTVNLSSQATIGGQGTGIISGVITGGSAAGLTIGTSSQTGTIALTGENTYSGTTTVNFGTLRIGNAGTAGSLNTASTITLNGGTIAFNRSDNISQGTQFSGAPIIGSGALNQTGPGILTLNPGNTYAGGTTIAGGTIQQGAANALPVGRALTVNGTGVFDLNGFGASIYTLGGAATGSVTDNTAGAGTSTLAITNAGSTPILIKNGASRTLGLRISNENGGFLLTNAGNTFSGGLVLTGSSAGTRMSPGAITAGAYGIGAITVGESATDLAGIYFATATQTLANPVISNTALGTDRVGTFRIDSTANTFSGQLTANLAPMTFSTNGTGSVTATGKITGPNGLTLLSQNLGGTALTVTLNNAAGTNDYAGDTVINQNPQVGKTYTLALGAADQIPNGAGKGNVTILTNGTGVGRLNLGGFSETINGLSGNGTVDGVSGTPVLTVGDNNAHGNFSGSLVNTAGAMAVIKTGTGVQVLSGASTYTGGTTVSAGTLISGNSSALGTGGLTVAGGATFAYQPASPGLLDLAGGPLNLAGGSRIGGAVGGTPGQSAITSTSAAVTAGTITVDVSGIPGSAVTTGTHALISAAGGLDTATYALGKIYNATNFTVNAGTLAASPTAVNIGVTSATALTGEFWKGGLSGAPAVWAISNGTTASNWASDAGGTNTPLTPGPAATLNFSAAGAANQSAMTLGASMSVAGISVSSASPFGLNADGNTLTLGAGGLTINSGAGAVTMGAATTLGAAQAWTNNSGSLLTISGTVANGGFTHSVGGSGNVSLTGSLTGNGGLTKTGTGTMTLTGISNYTGPTTVNGGTLKLGGAGVLPSTAAIVLGNTAGATFDINGNNSYVGSLAGGGAAGGTVSLGAANLATGRDNTSTTFSGVLTGAGGTFTKVGTGTQTLDGTVSNSFAGTTVVELGTLMLGKTGGAVAVTGPVTLGGGNASQPNLRMAA
ncbi:MAG TPA: autotransporter-associated beta strand repeat-containing protein, partial [Verrucomicrobiales bacterium]|nr:autotransporter-associated beta strand repeat-containing protein [Verrucomicrobiales bacterium]